MYIKYCLTFTLKVTALSLHLGEPVVLTFQLLQSARPQCRNFHVETPGMLFPAPGPLPTDILTLCLDFSLMIIASGNTFSWCMDFYFTALVAAVA